MVHSRTQNELEQELESISKELTETRDFLLYLRNNIKHSANDILSFIKVDEYDALVSELNDYQILTLINKRRNVLQDIEFSNHCESTTYQEYLDEYLDFHSEGADEPPTPMTESEFNEGKIGQLCVDLKEPLEFIADIIYGEKTSITRKDLDGLRRFSSIIPISETDIKSLTFRNRYHGFMGAMNNEDYNKLLGEALCGTEQWDVFKQIREIPFGYGWEGGLFTENKILAEINLDSPDHVLIEAFKNWLPHARKIHEEALDYEPKNSDKKINTNISTKWKKNRIITYLDMKILCAFFSVRPTIKQFGDYLFHDEYDVDTTEKMRKTINPLLKGIIEGDDLEKFVGLTMANHRY